VEVLCLSVLQCPYNDPRVNGPEDTGDKKMKTYTWYAKQVTIRPGRVEHQFTSIPAPSGPLEGTADGWPASKSTGRHYPRGRARSFGQPEYSSMGRGEPAGVRFLNVLSAFDFFLWSPRTVCLSERAHKNAGN
jgi:hypothetical protein